LSVSKKARVTFNLGSNLPPIDADASQIRQAVTNIVLNASEALGDDEGAITVSTGAGLCTRDELVDEWLHVDLAEGVYVWMEVADSGAGMDAETLARIFDPFFSTKFTGRGLGLPAVLGIVRGHQGLIKVRSAPGKGASFRMLFPVSKSAAVTGERRIADEGLDLGTGTILLVDDEDGVRLVAKSMLERLGYDVIPAADGQQALDLFAAHAATIRGVLLDVMMPVIDGLTTLARLKQIDPNVRVVMSSGFTAQDVNERVADHGPFAFIQKPYQIKTLGETLKKALG
jgi:CheY-like chemotaxis protein